MNATRNPPLVIANSKKDPGFWRRELADFDLRFAKNPSELDAEIANAAAIVLDLGEDSASTELEQWQGMSSPRLPGVSWFFVGALDEKGLRALAQFARAQLLEDWEFVKKPLLERELSLRISLRLEKNELCDKKERLARFSLLRNSLRGIGHELANLVLRTLSRADLAQMEGDPEKSRHHLEKLVQAAEATRAFVQSLQSVARADFKPAAGKLSIVVESSMRLIGPLLEREKIRIESQTASGEPMCELDPSLLTQAVQDVLGFLVERVRPAGLNLLVKEESRGGQPGVSLLISAPGHPLPAEFANRALEFGSDLRLPVAEQILRVHGGNLRLQAEPDAEVSIWLPCRSC